MKEEPGDPVLAENPYTGKLMNVEPLFRLMQDGYEYECVDDVIRYLNLNVDGDVAEPERLLRVIPCLSDLFLFLYSIRDMFRELSECGISAPKKKGGLT